MNLQPVIEHLPEIVIGLASVMSGITAGRFSLNSKVKKIVQQLCGDCNYRKQAMQIETEENRMATARRLYSTFYSEMKSDFLEYITLKNYIKNKDIIIDSKQMILFESVMGHVCENILTEIHVQFRRNNIGSLTESNMDDRVENLWNACVKLFDLHYKPKAKPNRIEIYDLFDDKKEKYMNILKKIYHQAKDVKIKK